MLFLLCYLLGNLRFLQAPVIQPSGWKTGATTHPALLYPHCGQGMGARCRGGGSRKEERVGAVTGAPPHALKLSFFMWRGDFLLSNLWAPAGSAFSHCNHCSRTTWELRHQRREQQQQQQKELKQDFHTLLQHQAIPLALPEPELACFSWISVCAKDPFKFSGHVEFRPQNSRGE